MKANSSNTFLFCRRRSQIMVFEGILQFSAPSSAGWRSEDLPNRRAQDRGKAQPAALASSIILRHSVFANGFASKLNIFTASLTRTLPDWLTVPGADEGA